MRKGRRRSSLRRMLAVLLSAVLVVGLAAGTPEAALAQEDAAALESVSGNAAEPDGEKAWEAVSGNEAQEKTHESGDILFDFDIEIYRVTDVYASWRIEPHIHEVSSDCSTASGDQESFTVLTGGGIMSDGSYYLDTDKAFSEPLTIPNGAVVNLCLNGHKLEYTGSEDNAVVVEKGGTLNLCDCNSSKGSHTLHSPATDEEVTLTGGILTRSEAVDAVGSGVRVYGSFNMYGGSIAGIRDTGDAEGIKGSHGAVRVEGIFHMYGGAITHNRSGCGGGVNVCNSEKGAETAYFYLHGGSVSYNYADYDDGGGICLNERCSFEMTGGEIKGNHAKSGGGGIECYGNQAPISDSVRIIGGVITENTTGGKVGGGIKCGDVGRPLVIAGNVRITGNRNSDGEESNLYLCNQKTVNIEGALDGDARIGVTVETPPTEGSPVTITGGNSADYSSFFRSDDSAYKIVDGEGHVVQFIYQTPQDKVKEAKEVVDEVLAGYVAANDTTKADIQNAVGEALRDAGITGVIVTVGDLTKEAATIGTEGSISGTILIEYETVREEVPIEMTIPKLPDTVPPTGAIKVDAHSWTSFLNTVTFGLFFREAKQVTIAAEDEGSGVDRVDYYIADRQMSTTELEKLEAWVAMSEAFSISPDRKCIIYARITDKAGNKTYLSSEGLVFDGTTPVISGVTGGETYRMPPTVTVMDENLEDVKVNDASVEWKDNEFTLLPIGEQTIVATDKAGNTTIVTVTVKTEAENVSDAKTVVDEVLADYTATNASTAQDIQNKIDEALSNAGITGVIATVGDLTQEAATKEKEGGISGSISIVCGSETDSVAINKAIEKLPLTEADKVEAAKAVVQEVLADYTATNASTAQELQDKIDEALSDAGITGVIVTVDDLSKTEATKDATGNISGSILIECGNETETVAINKPIARLPLSDADKVEAAKAVVQEVLVGYTATNDTKKADIQNAVDEALSDAGFTDVIVMVDDLSKTEATTDAAGSVSGSISIKCGNEIETVPINKPIAKLPLSDADKVEAAKAVVQEVLEGYTASNASTEQDIQDKIEEALSDVGITGVIVTVDDLSKTEATTDVAGNISGSILIECGNEAETVPINKPIAKLPHAGKVDTDVQTDGKAPATQISTDEKDLAEMLLTEAEKQQVADGTDIEIILDVKDASESVGGEDKAKVEAALSGYTTGQYLDISLYKLIAESRTNITETSEKITITIAIPDSLKNKDSATTRAFAVIRVHEGVAEILEDLDNSADTITIATDRFSTYAIVYKDTSIGENGSGDSSDNSNDSNSGDSSDNGNDGSNSSANSNSGSTTDNSAVNPAPVRDNEPVTGDSTPIELYATLAMIAGLSYLLLYFREHRRGMTEEKKREYVSRLIRWARQGGRPRRMLALAAVFLLLVYYHSIGKKVSVEWNAACE